MCVLGLDVLESARTHTRTCVTARAWFAAHTLDLMIYVQVTGARGYLNIFWPFACAGAAAAWRGDDDIQADIE